MANGNTQSNGSETPSQLAHITTGNDIVIRLHIPLIKHIIQLTVFVAVVALFFCSFFVYTYTGTCMHTPTDCASLLTWKRLSTPAENEATKHVKRAERW